MSPDSSPRREDGEKSPTDPFLGGLQQDLADYLNDLLTYRMPFGKYEGAFLDALPYEYLHWFEEKGGGFPSGRLGELMSFVYHTKAVGAEIVFADLRKMRAGMRR